MIGGASDLPTLESQESPPALKTSAVLSQDVRRGPSRAWSAAEGQLIGKKRRVLAVVAAAAGLGAVAGLVERSTCWKKRLISFFIFGHAQPSPGRADFYTDPSHFRPPSLQKQNMS